MAEEFTLMIKEILDRAGLEISTEQIESGLDELVEESVPEEDPWPDEVFKKIEAENKARGSPAEGGQSWKGGNHYVAISGRVDLEYSGRAHKKYAGDAVVMIKPDDSVVVQGMRGVNAVSYIARAEDIRVRSGNRNFTLAAASGSDRLAVTFLKMYAFESLFDKARMDPGSLYEKTPKKNIQATPASMADPETDLTADEKDLEMRLRKLRVDLAQREGISYLPAVYNNKTMKELVRQKPKTIDELRQVKGFGAKRIERYAASVLETINGSPAPA